MTSLNTRARKIRRFGVLARIEIVDVDNDEDNKKIAALKTNTIIYQPLPL